MFLTGIEEAALDKGRTEGIELGRAEGRTEGIKLGRDEGRAEEAKVIYERMVKDGVPEEKAYKIVYGEKPMD